MIGIITSCIRVGTTVWLHHLKFSETQGGEATYRVGDKNRK